LKLHKKNTRLPTLLVSKSRRTEEGRQKESKKKEFFGCGKWKE